MILIVKLCLHFYVSRPNHSYSLYSFIQATFFMPALKPTLILFLAAFFLSQYSQVTHAGDWPQILGPNRTGIADS